MDFSLIIPAFIAGILTFLAPCTLPLVPAYLGFISGVSLDDLKDPNKVKDARRKIFLNGVLYVLGFSAVFVLLGTLFGLLGSALVAYQFWLQRIGGVFIIFFGLYMLNIFKLPFFKFLEGGSQLKVIKSLKPGSKLSSFVLGSTLAVGWTPCVGPVLGAILTLAATSTTVWQGSFLLIVFSAGLAIPFLLVAATVGSASSYLNKMGKYLNAIAMIGGVFLLFLGILLLTDQLAVWISFSFRMLQFINYDALLNYL